MDTVISMEGGAFGSQAAAEARRRKDRTRVIDRDERCPAAEVIERRAFEADDIFFAPGGRVIILLGDLMLRWTPDRVIPATPSHLAARLTVARTGGALVPCSGALADVERAFPSCTSQLADREHVVVVACFMPPGGTCLDHCPCPPICPDTRRPLPWPMHAAFGMALAGAVDHAFMLTTAGIGAGGIAGKDFRTLLRTVDKLGEGETLSIVTASTCHALINLLRLRVR